MKKLILATMICALVSIAQAGDDKAASTKTAPKDEKAKTEATAAAVTDSWAKATGADKTKATMDCCGDSCCDTKTTKVLMSPKMAALASK